MRLAIGALALGACNAMFGVDDVTLESAAPVTAPSCDDGIHNGDESDVDCGGSCEACDDRSQNGAPCTDAGECRSGHCPPQDGVCCDSACALTCEACVEKKTGQPDGICDFVSPDLDPDPDAECITELPSTCGISNLGCAGDVTACRRWPEGTVCAEAFCASSTAHSEAKCDGAGTCSTADLTPCAPFVCDAAGIACLTSCTVQTDCNASHYCDLGTPGSCLLKKAAGEPCGQAYECQSGTCSLAMCT